MTRLLDNERDPAPTKKGAISKRAKRCCTAAA
jgi:hypothetical protein